MKVGSLCSGIDGLALGAERALGARTVWQSEIDRHASVVLAARWPGIPNVGDLRSVDWSAVEPVDVLCAGFPCQPVSTAGRRLGTEDERWLWDDIVDVIATIRPWLILLENVSGLLTLGFGNVLGDLADLGYDTRWHLLSSAMVGAPHRRQRIFIGAEDRYARRVRRWSDRRRGLHLDDPREARHDEPPRRSPDEQQGVAALTHDASPLRGFSRSGTPGEDGDQSGLLIVEVPRDCCGELPSTDSPVLAPEGGPGGSRYLVSRGQGGDPSIICEGPAVDRRAEGDWRQDPGEDEAAQPNGSTAGTSKLAAHGCDAGRLQGGGPVRGGADDPGPTGEDIRRPVAETRGVHERGDLRPAGSVPHRRERVFLAAAYTGSTGAGRDAGAVPRPAPRGRRAGVDVRAAGDGRAAATDADGLGSAGAGGARRGQPGSPDHGGTPPDADVDAEGREGHRSALQDGRREPASSVAADTHRECRRGPGDAEQGDGPAPHVRGGTPQPGGRRGPAAHPDGERLQVGPEPDSEPVHTAEGKHQLEGVDADGRVRWGAYEPAVRRWEAIHGPAPRPRDDRGRLNPQLAEWMMGLPAGWVTDPALGLPRTAQLRLIGNAVQPQVAELAARLLLAPLITAEAAA